MAGNPSAGKESFPAIPPPCPPGGVLVGILSVPPLGSAIASGKGGKAPCGAYQSNGLTLPVTWPAFTFTSINEWSTQLTLNPQGTACVYPADNPVYATT